MSVRARLLEMTVRHELVRAARRRRRALEAQVAVYTTPAERAELAALLTSPHGDADTAEMLDILVERAACTQRSQARTWRAVGGI